MTTHFITAEIDVSDADLVTEIETQLQHQGEPVRWAIAAVEEGRAQVEAVVTRTAEAQD